MQSASTTHLGGWFARLVNRFLNWWALPLYILGLGLATAAPFFAAALSLGVLLISSQGRSLLRRSEASRLGAIASLMVSSIDVKTTPSIQEMQRLMRLAVVEVGDSGEVYIIDRGDRILLHSGFDFTLVAEDDPLRDASAETGSPEAFTDAVAWSVSTSVLFHRAASGLATPRA